MTRAVISLFACMLLCGTLSAQRYPERAMVRQGNNYYTLSRYTDAEVQYRRAMEVVPQCYEAQDNLAKAFYKQNRYDEAARLLAPLAADSLGNTPKSAPLAQAHAYYDMGNALFEQRKFEQALEAYKQSLRMNPGDMEAKFNLAYTQKMLDQQKNGGGGNDNKDNKDNKDDKKNQPQNGQGQQKPQQGQPKPGDGGQDKTSGQMSKQEADQMLQAVQMGEDKTRDKMDKKAQPGTAASGKNW